MSRIKEQRFQAAGKEREKYWQNCGSTCSWGGGGGSAERKKEIADNKNPEQTAG
jgi:hypothetical protein